MKHGIKVRQLFNFMKQDKEETIFEMYLTHGFNS